MQVDFDYADYIVLNDALRGIKAVSNPMLKDYTVQKVDMALDALTVLIGTIMLKLQPLNPAARDVLEEPNAN